MSKQSLGKNTTDVPVKVELLPDVTALDLGIGISGPYCGRLLSELGAEVVKVEFEVDDRSRPNKPLVGYGDSPIESRRFLAFNASKSVVTLDFSTKIGCRQLLELIETSDIVIENFDEGVMERWGLSYEAFKEANPRIIMTSIRSFGNWGPYTEYQASDLILSHMSGHALEMETPDGENVPVRASGGQADLVAGASAANITLMELYRSRMLGIGCHVVVSAYESMVNQRFGGFVRRNDQVTSVPRLKKPQIIDNARKVPPFLPCKDGRVVASPRQDAQWKRWIRVLGDPDWAQDARFATVQLRQENRFDLWQLQSELTQKYSKCDLAKMAQEHRVPCFPVNEVSDLLDDEHLSSRGFFVKINHPKSGPLIHPGVPFHVLSGGSRKNIVSNPAHDQNNSEGISRPGDVKKLRAPKREKQLLRNPSGNLPLKGIRVLDLGWIISAPLSTRYLAVMGAEVIKVGSKVRSEFEARTYNQSKLSCTINVSVPEGVELVKRLVAESHVVVENLSTGAIDRMGLGYEVLRVVRPDIIMVSSSGLGHTGPDKDLLAYGSLLQHYTGWNSITGGGGIAADPWVALQLAMVTVAALNYRAITGHGQYIDFSMVESLLSAMAEPILEYQITGRIPEPTGNKDMEHVPHGIYQCLEERSWVAIAVTNETQWGALCGLIGRPDLAMKRDLLYSNLEEGFLGEVEGAISKWTAQYEDYEAARLLQTAGVPAGPSLDSTRVPCDPQLLEGGYFTPFETDDGEVGLQPGVPWRFSDGQSPRLVEAPVLGQDNEYVFREILGISEQEVNQLMDQKVIY